MLCELLPICLIFLFVIKKRRAITGWNSVSFQVVDILNTNTDIAEVIRDYNMVRISIFAIFEQ